MKHAIPLFTFAFCLHLSLLAAVPLRWTVETSRATPATFEAYQGETIYFEADLQSAGKPLEMSGLAEFFWQTNGMGSAYWETTAAVNSNRLSAVFTPEMDVGARVYNCFIGVPGTIYHAAFQLRLRPSPGAIPNTLPLPVPVIDFAKVRVLNPPWPTGGTDTNAVIDIIHETVDGAARPLPKYLHTYDADDSYPDAAQEYYRSRGDGKVDGGCSAVRRGGFLYRNFDFPFDDRAEFVVKMSAGPNRFASVGVAQVGTNLTEQIVTSGKPSRWYKALPGATVDGINERGVCAEINVVDTPVTGWHTNGDIHPLAAVRWVLDNATNAQHGAEYLAANVRFPAGWTQNFHYMIADAEKTYVVENGTATDGDEYHESDEPVTMTNFQLSKFPWDGMGMERFGLLLGGLSITNAWYTRAYLRSTDWASEFHDAAEMEAAKSAWETHTREQLRGHGLWQSVHTSVYDLTNRTLRISVQETDDWYTFAVPVTAPEIDAYTRAETDAKLASAAVSATNYTDSCCSTLSVSVARLESATNDLSSSVSRLESSTSNLTARIDGLRGKNDLVVYAKEYDFVGASGVYEQYSMTVEPGQPFGEWCIYGRGDEDEARFMSEPFDTEFDALAAISNREPIVVMRVYGTWSHVRPGTIIEARTIPTDDRLATTDTVSAAVTDVSEEIDVVRSLSWEAVNTADGAKEIAESVESLAQEAYTKANWLEESKATHADATNAAVAVVAAATNNVPALINRSVSAALNTYVDGETGVEYVGKWYGDSMYYVPTGNVYPPNN